MKERKKMCGIVGYIGKKNAISLVVEGLKRLEYRGYDSAGVAIINKEDDLKVFKAEGKIIELEKVIPTNDEILGNIGIAHTRWATHGQPNEKNAHPHVDNSGKIAIVHNGIIENYRVIKAFLEEKNYKFYSETDTEVLVNLISFMESEYHNLEISVREALKKVEGTFGLAVISSDYPNQIIAARKGSPLILGIGKDEYFVASDVSATIIHTKDVIYLQDNEMVILTQEGYTIKTLRNEIVEAKIDKVDWDISQMEKGDFKHFMLKEIFEQPISVGNAFRGRLYDNLSTTRLGGIGLSLSELRKVKKIQIIGCGTSWHAGLIGKNIIEQIARIPVDVEYASEYRYRNPIIPEDTIVIVISQSGETADTLAAMREAQARGAKVFGITNVVGSTIARETDGGVYSHAGSEIGVASTKAFTSQITVLGLLAVLLGRMTNMSPIEGMEFIKEIREIPNKIKKILSLNDEIREIAKSMVNSTNALYLGRGVHYPVALEGALKLKEISYIHAEGYPAAEMKHGPLALIDENMPVVAIALNDSIYDKIISNLQEVKARDGQLIVIASEGDKLVKKMAKHVIYIPDTIYSLQPILSVIPLQLLAYHVADLKGYNVDQPRNLAKSVTVE